MSRSSLLLLAALLICWPAFAQFPAADPAFLPTAVYTRAPVRQAIQQPDGKRLLVGFFERIQGVGSPGIARLLANGNALDAVFQRNVDNLQGRVGQALLLPNGQILLAAYSGSDSLKLNNVRRRTFLRLNSDGTPDPSFDAGRGLPPGPNYVGPLGLQPDGKLVVTGAFAQFNGQVAAGVVRLLPTGGLDGTFASAGAGLAGQVYGLQIQGDGKIVLAGTFTSVYGQPVAGLARLLPGGALDSSFGAATTATTQCAGVALQPDGKLVVALAAGSVGGRTQGVQRLLPSGGLDPGFQLDPQAFVSYFLYRFDPAQAPVCVLPTGALLVTGNVSVPGVGVTSLVQLTPAGLRDASFAMPPSVITQGSIVGSMQPLPGGQVLVCGTAVRYGGGSLPPTTVALLNADGTRDGSLAPRPQSPGSVVALARQRDAKLLVGGQFNEINGVAVDNLARLNPDGSVDVAYSNNGAGVDGPVNALTVQPDGKLLVVGEFGRAGGVRQPTLARFLVSGGLDTAFAPALASPGSATFPNELAIGRQVLFQPDGKVMVQGLLGSASLANIGLVRLDGATGTVDASFQAGSFAGNTQDFARQSDGKYVVAGRFALNGQAYALARLLPDGSLDPGFALTPRTSLNNATLWTVELDASDRIHVGGNFAAYGPVPTRSVARLLPDGTPDPGFVCNFSAARTQTTYALAFQPNGRILLGGNFYVQPDNGGLARLLANGGLDASLPVGRTANVQVYALLVQPDGAILAGGNFTQAFGALPYYGLVRLLDNNVLNVAAKRETPLLEAWPVPAHDVLHVQLEAAARPQEVLLHDAVGRRVLRQAASQSQTVLNTASLMPGVYVLSVRYATGTVVRRIAVE